MKKLAKKSMSLLTALLMVVVFTGAANVFAGEPLQPEDYKVISNLSVSGIFMSKKVTGTVDISKTIKSCELVQVAGEEDLYKGNIEASVEAADLFEGAYKVYKKKIKGQGIGPWKWENLVMFSKGEEFPTAQYTIYFPKNFDVKLDDITFSENTSTISKIEKSYDETNSSVTFTFNLGNWNDYKEFFKLVAGERGQSGHRINLKIPYTVKGNGESLGTITGSGSCLLYKYGKNPVADPIVRITSPVVSIDVKRP